MHIGVNSAVKIKKNKEIPSTAKKRGPHLKFKAGGTIHSV